ncbi:cation-translocating P-type ATPase [Enterococcus gallinarum]|uniref:HAD ATPase, P-type, family IC n=1 Tax=Enterococcus gallinarum TaxID=1353 RepID=A0A376H4F5_ENTGA|nr:HAD-IC family P-type ATPase [Enterococcus gallinarum]OJG49558.1 ATPase [Enterococcus gallinarum]STD85156.1 HAD ATPase, P-type, family IC [Enterococcus gallinarum]STD87630.1 HAD ATPase, P-type, family IC [Enterococcus gallinarum]
MENFYQRTPTETLEYFHSDQTKGLSKQGAKEALDTYGENTIQQQESTSPWKLLWHNLNNLIVYLLLAAALLSFAMGETIEGIAVLIAVVIAVMTGFVTELRAQKSIDSLQEMIYTTAKVIRDGQVMEVESAAIVPGDILVLAEGDAIAADARLLESRNLACIESALTGESEAVEKNAEEQYDEDVPLGDRRNVVFAGTAVTRGNGYAVVTATGMKTEVGKISDMLTGNKSAKTPLDIELDKLGKAIIIAALFAAVTVLIAGLLTDQPLVEMLHISIILAVAAIPEAMPAVSTITLSRGMRIMAEHKALVKTLSAVETLGATSIIASDKTGTLTENQMTIAEIILSNGEQYTVTGKGYEPTGSFHKEGQEISVNEEPALQAMIENGALCTSASLKETDGQFEVLGDPTDGAFVVLGKKEGIDRQTLMDQGIEKIAELPFDSENKFMITVYEKEQRTLIMKGAPDVLIEKAAVDRSVKEQLNDINHTLASNGQRVIAVAQISNYQGGLSESELTESLDNIEIQGFVGIIDPPRTDVKEAVKIAQEAGIRVKMITGDHPQTASMIAQEIGLIDFDKTMTGKEIDALAGKEEFNERIKEVAVFARVSPENKLQLVKALREEGEIVSMTGDGVNDAPALNGADIGIAMGIRGTEVAKESSDMILTDDRFGTIVDAIKEGRIIFDNIKKYVSFLFSCNMVEIVTIFLSVIFLLPMPIQPLHILFLNLVIDIAPAMALAFEPAEEDLMKRQPRSKEDSLVNKRFLGRIILSGIVIGLTAFGFFSFLIQTNHELAYAQTATFTFMAIAQLMHIFNVRKQSGFGLDKSFFKNKALIGALILSIGLQLSAVYLPFMNELLGTSPLQAGTWGIIFLAASLSTLVVMGLKKAFQLK